MSAPTWDMFAAELVDVRQAERLERITASCIYCGRPTRALSKVCTDHRDLTAIDPDYTCPEPYPIPWRSK